MNPTRYELVTPCAACNGSGKVLKVYVAPEVRRLVVPMPVATHASAASAPRFARRVPLV